MTQLQAIGLVVAFIIAISITLGVTLFVTAVVYEIRDRYRRRGHGGYVVIRPSVEDTKWSDAA